MDFIVKKKRKKVLLSTVPMPEISMVNQVPGRKIDPAKITSVEECIKIANNESFLGGRSQPAIGLRFLKENIPSVDILEFPEWGEFNDATKQGYDVLGISFYTTNFNAAVKMAGIARENGVREVWAGNYGTFTPGASSHFDKIFIGYPDRELKSLIENEKIDAIRHPIITTPFSSVLPAGEEAGYLFTIKGCRFKCEFCCTKIFSPDIDILSIKEIERALATYKEMGIRYINIGDETFLQHRTHARRVLELLKKYGMKWFCSSRVDLITGNVRELARFGFDSVYMGIESMNDANLLDQKKGQSSDKIYRVFSELRENNVSTSGTYILGLPNDTVPSLKEDLDKLSRLPVNIIIFIIFTPYPELPIYGEWLTGGLITSHNWDEYDGLHVVFRHPHMSREELMGIYEYAICNVYSPYNYNKRRVLQRIKKLQNSRPGMPAMAHER
ncbi:MAG: radical SAM protein [Spirochaetes bacterium]|nr:radical SAM protein [Spirochaetota bacterium]